ncbi:hypothetical protein STEG23_034916 [Scotinomys teguina]
MTEERQRVFLEARKNVPGDDGRPTQLPSKINEAFPLTRTNWDFNTGPVGIDFVSITRFSWWVSRGQADAPPIWLRRCLLEQPRNNGPAGWVRLPQGFKNSPTLFNGALHQDLVDVRVSLPDLTLLQYVDDILLAAETEQECLQAAVATLVKDSDKLTLGQPLTVMAPHAIETVIRQPPDWWLSNVRITHYQAMLLNPEQIRFGIVTSLNLATLLPEGVAEVTVEHNCHQVLTETQSTRENLTDQLLPNADFTWYTDGSSFLHQGERWAGAAVVDSTTVIWVAVLTPGTSAQQAELVALTQALKVAQAWAVGPGSLRDGGFMVYVPDLGLQCGNMADFCHGTHEVSKLHITLHDGFSKSFGLHAVEWRKQEAMDLFQAKMDQFHQPRAPEKFYRCSNIQISFKATDSEVEA